MPAGLIFQPPTISSDWQYTAGPTGAAHGDKWVIGLADDLTLPAGPTNGQFVQIAPGTLIWDGTTGNIITTDTSTIGIGQSNIPSEAEVVTLVYDAGADNWKIMAAGTGLSFQAVDTVAALPPAATVTVGTEYKVVNDPAPLNANDGTWTAVGASVGLPATTWIQG